MVVKILTEHNLEFLSLKGGCRGHLSPHMSKCHVVGNLMHWFIWITLYCNPACVSKQIYHQSKVLFISLNNASLCGLKKVFSLCSVKLEYLILFFSSVLFLPLLSP